MSEIDMLKYRIDQETEKRDALRAERNRLGKLLNPTSEIDFKIQGAELAIKTGERQVSELQKGDNGDMLFGLKTVRHFANCSKNALDSSNRTIDNLSSEITTLESERDSLQR